MSYKNAKEILPQKLISEIQKYVKGEVIYIPTQDEKKTKWGTKNGSRKKYDTRNEDIRRLRKNGISIDEIAQTYYLSPESIKKILNDNRCVVKS